MTEFGLDVKLPGELSGLLARSASSHSEAELFLVDKLQGRRVALPVLPQVAAQALQLANDPDASVAQFAELVESDPPIAARFLATANSALYSRGLTISSVLQAVGRVGLATARDLVFQVVYASGLTGLGRFQGDVRRSFKRSVRCGVVCSALSSELGFENANAYLCGLLHDIGESRVYRILSNYPSKGVAPLTTEEAARLVERYHCRAGGELAERWGLPQSLVTVCREHESPDADGLAPAVKLVKVANRVLNELDQSGAHSANSPKAAAQPMPEQGDAEGQTPLQKAVVALGLDSANTQRLLELAAAALAEV